MKLGMEETLSLQALCNDGSINACTLMSDDSHTAMNAILKANNLGFLENLAAWFFLHLSSSKSPHFTF